MPCCPGTTGLGQGALVTNETCQTAADKEDPNSVHAVRSYAHHFYMYKATQMTE